MDKESILKILGKVKYPPYEKDIVSFGIVKEVFIDGANVEIGIFTAAKKEKNDLLSAQIKEILEENFKNINVSVKILESDPAKDKASAPAKETLANVKVKIAIASGKGGVGKSTVAANLARAFAKIFSKNKEAKVGLMDCDIHGPSAGILLGKTAHPTSDGEKIFPPEKNGVKTISMGMLVDASQPLIWRGPMITSAIKQFANDVEWGELDIMVLDLPPGTGDAVISVAQIIPLNGAVIITTANKLAESTATRGAKIFEKMNIPILGVVENMSYLELFDGSKMKVFGEGDAEACAKELSTSVLAQIPIDTSLQTDKPSEKSEKLFDKLALDILMELEKK